jgi:hypothetical protein
LAIPDTAFDIAYLRLIVGKLYGTYLGSLDGNESRHILADESSVVFGSGHCCSFEMAL